MLMASTFFTIIRTKVRDRIRRTDQQRSDTCGCRWERDQDESGIMELHHYCQKRKDFFN